jgi:hypothetical protein
MCDGLGAELFKFRPLDKDDALPMVRKACAGEMRGRPGGRPGPESVHSTTLGTLWETIASDAQLESKLKRHPLYDQGSRPDAERTQTMIQNIDALIRQLKD